MAYNFQGYGGIGEAISQALLQQQQLRRQAIIDEITQRRQQQDLVNAQMQQQLLGDQRRALIDQTNERTAAGTAAMLLPQQPVSAADTARLQQGGLGSLITPAVPSTIANVEQQPTQIGPGLLQQGPGPTLGTATFRGTPAQLQAQQKAAQLDQYLADPNTPDVIKQFISAQRASGDNNLPAALFQQPKPATEPVMRVNPRTGQVEQIGSAPSGAHFVQEPQPAAPDVALVLNGAALDMTARMYAKTGQLPPMGMGKAGAQVRTAVINRAAGYDPSSDTFTGTAVPDIASNKAGYVANTASLGALQKNIDAATAFANTADKNSARLADVMKRVPDTGVPFLNMPLRAAAVHLGDTTVSELGAIRQSVSNEYARLISQPNLAGTLSDRARREMDAILNPDATPKQIEAALRQLQAEAHNRVTSYQDQLDTIQGRIRGTTPAPAGSHNDPLGIRK